MGLFSAIGSAFSGLGGAVIGAGTSLFNGFMNRKAANDAWNDSARMSWDMWHAANAYNSPAQQMARYKAAGLNPNLIYGQMSNVPMPALIKKEPYNFNLDMDLGLMNKLENQQLTNQSVREGIYNQRSTGAQIDSATRLNNIRSYNEERAAEDAHKESLLRQKAFGLNYQKDVDEYSAIRKILGDENYGNKGMVGKAVDIGVRLLLKLLGGGSGITINNK